MTYRESNYLIPLTPSSRSFWDTLQIIFLLSPSDLSVKIQSIRGYSVSPPTAPAKNYIYEDIGDSFSCMLAALEHGSAAVVIFLL